MTRVLNTPLTFEECFIISLYHTATLARTHVDFTQRNAQVVRRFLFLRES